jgi:hypothetical protein
LDRPRLVRILAAPPTLAAGLLAISTVAAAASWLGPRGWDWASQGVSQARVLGADAGQLIISLCIANRESEAMRQWIAQHPKSPRGRLNHQRSNAATAG